MIFSTLEFFLFLIVLLPFYYLVKPKWQWLVLLLASILMLGYLSSTFLLYTLLLTTVNYSLGIFMHTANVHKKKGIYLLAMYLNIGQLVFFKYINFLLGNLASLLGILNTGIEIPYLHIIAPIGISYYTFEFIGYQINVYRGTEDPEAHFGIFASYVLFFPKLLAGPIERTKTFLPKLKTIYSFKPAVFHNGLIQLFWGFFKKLVIADRLFPMVQNIYGNIDEYSGVPLIITYILQVFHMYCDFSGYTDIMLGIGKLFGIQLTNNFERPLLAQNVSMFWRKWHITLSNWCNDYIFKKILLKRMRWKKWAAVYGVFVSFLIIGIWHGAGWTFIILGLLQGIAINYEFFTKRQRLQLAAKLPTYWVRFLSRSFVFLFFGLTLIFFNAQSLGDAFYFVGHLFTDIGGKWVGFDMGIPRYDYLIALTGVGIVYLVDYTNEQGKLVRTKLNKYPALKWSLYYGLVLAVLIFGKFASSDFVYFQF
ncbi:MAG: MBOAT family O-acyltransferase [Bacteroidales bacterium]